MLAYAVIHAYAATSIQLLVCVVCTLYVDDVAETHANNAGVSFSTFGHNAVLFLSCQHSTRPRTLHSGGFVEDIHTPISVTDPNNIYMCRCTHTGGTRVITPVWVAPMPDNTYTSIHNAHISLLHHINSSIELIIPQFNFVSRFWKCANLQFILI